MHALVAQALLATSQSYAPFIHAVKPHPGQVWAAAELFRLVAGSKVIRDEAAGARGHRAGKLIQDRYSLRCMPQFLGPAIDGLWNAAGQIEVEANCANDNPLIDPDSGEKHVAVYAFGDTTKVFNNGDSGKVVASFGVGVVY